MFLSLVFRLLFRYLLEVWNVLNPPTAIFSESSIFLSAAKVGAFSSLEFFRENGFDMLLTDPASGKGRTFSSFYDMYRTYQFAREKNCPLKGFLDDWFSAAVSVFIFPLNLLSHLN